MRVVVNMESDEREVLGEYLGTDEDTVRFMRGPNVAPGSAPADCVKIVEYGAGETRAEFERWQRVIESNAGWIGDGTTPATTALNGIVALAVEMLDYAHTFGAALTQDEALRDLRRKYGDGYRIGSCAAKVEA